MTSGASSEPSIRELLERAETLYQAGDLEQAWQAVQHLTSGLNPAAGEATESTAGLDPATLRGLVLRARIRRDRGQHPQAVATFVTIHRRGKLEDRDLSYLAGQLLERRDTSEGAHRVYLDYLAWPWSEDLPGRFRQWVAALAVLYAPRHRDEGTWPKTLVRNRDVLARREQVPWAHYHLGWIHTARGHWGPARERLLRVCELQPNHDQTRALLACVCLELHRYEEAKSHFDVVLAHRLQPRLAALRAQCTQRLDLYDNLRDLRDALRADAAGKPAALAWAVSLLGAGTLASAGRGVDAESPPAEPTAALVAGVVARLEGRVGEALARLTVAVASETVQVPASRHLVVAAAADLRDPGVLDALDAIPATQRNDLFWLVRGNACLVRGDARGALESWRHIQQPTAVLCDRATGVARYYLAERYNCGDDAGVIAAVQDGLMKLVRPRAVACLAAAALARRAMRRSPASAAVDAGCLREIERVCAQLPDVSQDAHLRLVAAKLRAGREGKASVAGGPSASLRPVSAAHAGLHQRLREQADAVGEAEPATCHPLALFHLAEGSRLAEHGEWAAALQAWEWSVAYLGVVLAHAAYLNAFVEGRAAVYGVTPSTEDRLGLERCVIERWERVFSGAQPRAVGMGRADVAAILVDLPVALRAEVHAARLLGDQGGFELEGNPCGNVSAGPIYLALRGLEVPFLHWFCQKAGADEGLSSSETRHLLQALRQPGGEAGASARFFRTDLEKLFSRLRFAAVLEREGQLEQALQRLRALAPWDAAAPSSAPTTETGEAGQTPIFLRCNPVFGNDGGGARYRRMAAEMQATLLFHLGDQCLASSEQRIDAGAAYWREAVELERSYGAGEFAARIERWVIGRGAKLAESHRDEEGVRLLETVADFCDNSQTRGMLANFQANVAIGAANENQDWAKAVAGLRRARQLTQSNSRINESLVTALSNHADKLQNLDPGEACTMLREALRLAVECVRADPRNEQLRKMAMTVRANHDRLYPPLRDADLELPPPTATAQAIREEAEETTNLTPDSVRDFLQFIGGKPAD